MFCAKCGKELREGANFCPFCGSAVKTGAEMTLLVESAKNGDQLAIEELYKRTFRKYEVTAAQILRKTMASDEVYDVLQDAYMRIFKNLDRLDDPEKFGPRGRRIVTNTALNAIRGNHPVFMEDDSLPDVEGYDPERDRQMEMHNPEEIYDRKQTGQIVREIIMDLPEEQAKCIYMFYMQDLSVKDIGSMLGVSDNTVKSRLKYGRSKIEQKVLDAEKRQGIRLHGIAPFPFFLGMFADFLQGEEESAGMERAGEGLSRILEEAGGQTTVHSGMEAGGSTTAGKDAAAQIRAHAETGGNNMHGAGGGGSVTTGAARTAGEAAGAAGKAGTAGIVGKAAAAAAAGTSVAVKLAAAVIAAAVVGGGAFGITRMVRPQRQQAAAETAAVQAETLAPSDGEGAAETGEASAASEDAAAAETKKMVPEPGESAEAKEEEKGNAESADTAEGEKEDAQDVPAAPAEDPEMVYKDVLNAYINTVQSHSLDSRIEDAVKAYSGSEYDQDPYYTEAYLEERITDEEYKLAYFDNLYYTFRDLNGDDRAEMLLGRRDDTVCLYDIWTQDGDAGRMIFSFPVTEGFVSLGKDDTICMFAGGDLDGILDAYKVNGSGIMEWSHGAAYLCENEDAEPTKFFRLKKSLPEMETGWWEHPEFAEEISEAEYNIIDQEAVLPFDAVEWKPLPDTVMEDIRETVSDAQEDWSGQGAAAAAAPAFYEVLHDYNRVLNGEHVDGSSIIYEPDGMAINELLPWDVYGDDARYKERLASYDLEYMTADLNSDGTEELIIQDRYSDEYAAEEFAEGEVEIWILKNGEAVRAPSRGLTGNCGPTISSFSMAAADWRKEIMQASTDWERTENAMRSSALREAPKRSRRRGSLNTTSRLSRNPGRNGNP